MHTTAPVNHTRPLPDKHSPDGATKADMSCIGWLVLVNALDSVGRYLHCLSHLYTVKFRPSGAMRLRICGHCFELPTIRYEFNKRNFVVCLLFNYV